MKKRKVMREGISSHFVKNTLFEEGNLFLKIRHLLGGVLTWLAVLLPLVWLALPIMSETLIVRLHFQTDSEELQLLTSLVILLTLSFALMAVLYRCLALLNKRCRNDALRNEKTCNAEKSEHKRVIYEDVFQKSFGEKEYPERVRHYFVAEKQNLEKEFIKENYKRRDMSL